MIVMMIIVMVIMIIVNSNSDAAAPKRGGGRTLLIEILLARIARQRIRCLISIREKLEQLKLKNLSSMRVTNPIIARIPLMKQ